MKRGLTVDILDGYDNLLWKVLKPIDITVFDWRVRDEESYLIARGELDEALFPEEPSVVEGLALKKLVKDNIY
ncbi:TPA: DUF2691 family protein, partial [Bacillus cereus]|nr:DUF2691 family protein [Bacillus cereus]